MLPHYKEWWEVIHSNRLLRTEKGKEEGYHREISPRDGWAVMARSSKDLATGQCYRSECLKLCVNVCIFLPLLICSIFSIIHKFQPLSIADIVLML